MKRNSPILLEDWVKVEAQNWRPHDYQKKAVKFLLEHGSAGLFLDPG